MYVQQLQQAKQTVHTPPSSSVDNSTPTVCHSTKDLPITHAVTTSTSAYPPIPKPNSVTTSNIEEDILEVNHSSSSYVHKALNTNNITILKSQ
jgi:hypothetical protein